MLSVADFARSSPLKLLPFGGRSCGACSVARAPRLLLCRDADAVLVWRLPAAAAAAELAAAAAANANGAAGGAERAPAAAAELAPPRMLLRLKPKLTRRLLFDACLSPTGRYLACVDAEPRLYEVELGGEGDGADGAPPPPPPPSVRRRALPAAARPAACCAFSADERLLLLGGLDGAIQAVAVDAAAAAADGADDAAAVHTLRGPPGAAAPPALLQIVACEDGQWLAAREAGGRVAIYSLDALAFAAHVPPTAAPPTAIAFAPHSSLLLVACADGALMKYDVEGATAEPCALPPADLRPPQLASRAEVVTQLAFNPARPAEVVLCGQSFLFRVPLDGVVAAEAPAAAEAAAEAAEAGGGGAKKRKRGQPKGAKKPKGGGGGGGGGEGGAPAAAAASSRYQPMLLFDFLGDDRALVVERPWLRVIDHFPPTLQRQRFGT